LATISIYIYLRKTCGCGKDEIKRRWKYITLVYSTTLIVNLIFFYGLIPVLANINLKKDVTVQQELTEISLEVGIPCTGHAFLIIDEIKKCDGVNSVEFILPNIFKVQYEAEQSVLEKIKTLEIFKDFKMSILKD
jgi:hypothetical protein